MNYKKILDEQHRLGLSNEKMAQHIGMKSGTGYQQMIDNQTLKVSNLEKIAEVFQKPCGMEAKPAPWRSGLI